MTVHKTWVVIYSSDPIANHDLANRLKGLEWWITNEDNYEESKTATRFIDLTLLKDQRHEGQGLNPLPFMMFVLNIINLQKESK